LAVDLDAIDRAVDERPALQYQMTIDGCAGIGH
jgi:hypothetical protein